MIALAILGVIATFTIPKIITAQANSQYNASAKEAIAAFSQAYQSYSITNTLTANTTFGSMTPYLNYLSVDNSSVIDDAQTGGSLTCGTNGLCLRLHSGGILMYDGTAPGGTASTYAWSLKYDPNGSYGGTTNGPDKSVQFILYMNGLVTTRGTCLASTTAAGSTFSAAPTRDPPWFSW